MSYWLASEIRGERVRALANHLPRGMVSLLATRAKVFRSLPNGKASTPPGALMGTILFCAESSAAFVWLCS